MADLLITSITNTGNLSSRLGGEIAAEAVAEGKAGYKDTTSSQYRIANCETSETTAQLAGFFKQAASLGSSVDLHTSGPMTVDVVLTAYEEYFLGPDGKIQPYADLAVGDWIVSAGFASATDVLNVFIRITGLQKA